MNHRKSDRKFFTLMILVVAGLALLIVVGIIVCKISSPTETVNAFTYSYDTLESLDKTMISARRGSGNSLEVVASLRSEIVSTADKSVVSSVVQKGDTVFIKVYKYSGDVIDKQQTARYPSVSIRVKDVGNEVTRVNLEWLAKASLGNLEPTHITTLEQAFK